MDIGYLREFIEVGLQLNLSRASSSLHMSQSALSKHLSSLERECGVELLHRTTHHIELTRAGKLLFEDASVIIRLYDEMFEHLRLAGEVCDIVVSGLYKNTAVLDLINDALKAMNDHETTASVSYSGDQGRDVERILSHDVDVCFTIMIDGEEVPAGLERTFLFDDPMICLVKPSNPLAGREALRISDLASQRILQPVGARSTEHGRATTSRIFAAHGINPVQKPVFVQSINELASAPNDDCMLIMEESMLRTQPFSEDYRMLTFEPDEGAFYRFYALHRDRVERPQVSQFVHEAAALARGNAGDGLRNATLEDPGARRP